MIKIYADHNATSPLCAQSLTAMTEVLAMTGNPSSIHGAGRAMRKILSDARAVLADAFGVQAQQVSFTSGATEGLHLAMEQAADLTATGQFEAVFVSSLEHDAVAAYAKKLWPSHQTIPARANGTIDEKWLADALATSGPAIVIAQAANNESGVIHNIDAISTMVRANHGLLICDGTQILGKASLGLLVGQADFLILSSHKLGGPMGAGVVIAAPPFTVLGRRSGGGQEFGARAGTENVAAIAGFAAAFEAAAGDDAVADYISEVGAIRDGFEQALSEATPPESIEIIGQNSKRLANTSLVVFKGLEASRLVMAADLASIAISAGSACSSGKVSQSRVLLAIGKGGDDAKSAVRVSFGRTNSAQDGKDVAAILAQHAKKMIENKKAEVAGNPNNPENKWAKAI